MTSMVLLRCSREVERLLWPYDDANHGEELIETFFSDEARSSLAVLLRTCW